MIDILFVTGGTNFGFLNGANTISLGQNNSGLEPTTTSYDYDSPISEFGNLTEKYFTIKSIISNHTTIKTKIPDIPDVRLPTKYPNLSAKGALSFYELINNPEVSVKSENVLPMEKLPINDNAGQSYGYIVYRKTNLKIPTNSILKIAGFVRDTVMVLINGKLVSRIPQNAADVCNFGYWKLFNSTLSLTKDNNENLTLDLIVENMGRVNYGHIKNFAQFKGLMDDVYLNNEKILGWNIIPFEFKKSWNKNLTGWSKETTISSPALYKFELNLSNTPEDTFLDMRNWTKGIAIVNGMVLGRYFFVGPEQSLYLPAPFLKKGSNDIILFEHFKASKFLKFSKIPLYLTPFNFTGCFEPSKASTNSLYLLSLLSILLIIQKLFS